MRHVFHILVAALGAATVAANAQPVEILNPVGDLLIRASVRKGLGLKRTGATREPRPEDVRAERLEDRIRIVCDPSDGARIDLEVEVPFGVPIRAETKQGRIAFSGPATDIQLRTESGAVRIEAPWQGTRLAVTAREKPAQIELPEGIRFNQQWQGSKKDRQWIMHDRLDDMKIVYGGVRVEAGAPTSIELADIPPPPDLPVKLPWMAEEVLQSLRAGPPKTAPGSTGPKGQPDPPPIQEGVAVFHSEVREVAITAAVGDAGGSPLLGLKKEDFEVLENGEPQTLNSLGAEEVPFNLALLLDLSGSTREDRAAMKEAAKQFIGVARPQDRVAIYALANDRFVAVSRLTADRAALTRTIDAIPEASGGSPVYDAIVLGCAEEFRTRLNERNALIVISDGIDNQIHAVGTPSTVPFRKLLDSAGVLNTVIYPVFLDPYDVAPAPGWARKAKQNLDELSKATGGKLFPARNIRDLEGVYELVAQELRSVYSLNYSPRNQSFDGQWRRIEVRVKTPGARVRARPGYYAW